MRSLVLMYEVQQQFDLLPLYKIKKQLQKYLQTKYLIQSNIILLGFTPYCTNLKLIQLITVIKKNGVWI